MRAGQSARIILPLYEGVNRRCRGQGLGLHWPFKGQNRRHPVYYCSSGFAAELGVPIAMAMNRNPKAKNRTEMKPAYPFLSLPKAQGLYCPKNEHDACGVGFIANIEGQKSHDIVL